MVCHKFISNHLMAKLLFHDLRFPSYQSDVCSEYWELVIDKNDCPTQGWHRHLNLLSWSTIPLLRYPSLTDVISTCTCIYNNHWRPYTSVFPVTKFQEVKQEIQPILNSFFKKKTNSCSLEYRKASRDKQKTGRRRRRQRPGTKTARWWRMRTRRYSKMATTPRPISISHHFFPLEFLTLLFSHSASFSSYTNTHFTVSYVAFLTHLLKYALWVHATHLRCWPHEWGLRREPTQLL